MVENGQETTKPSIIKPEKDRNLLYLTFNEKNNKQIGQSHYERF